MPEEIVDAEADEMPVAGLALCLAYLKEWWIHALFVWSPFIALYYTSHDPLFQKPAKVWFSVVIIAIVFATSVLFSRRAVPEGDRALVWLLGLLVMVWLGMIGSLINVLIAIVNPLIS